MKNEMIAKVLKKYRKHNNYTVSDVANMLEDKSIRVAEKTIYGWEQTRCKGVPAIHVSPKNF